MRLSASFTETAVVTPYGIRRRKSCGAARQLSSVLVAALLLGIAGRAGATDEAAAAAPLTQADVLALVRTGQLAEWFNEPLTQAQALCTQSAFASHWPANGLRPDNDRDEEALRLAREKCIVSSPGEEEGRPSQAFLSFRLVPEWRASYLSQARRLTLWRLGAAKCIGAGPGAPVDMVCLRAAVGQALSPRDWESLVVALRVPP